MRDCSLAFDDDEMGGELSGGRKEKRSEKIEVALV